VDAVDALAGLRLLAGMGIDIPDGCAGPLDVDCDGDFDAVDVLKLLLFIAGLPTNLPGGCAQIGV
jgi:hypothetical protein